MDEPDRSSKPPTEADDQPPSSIEVELFDGLNLLNTHELDSLAQMTCRALAQLPNSGQIRVSIVDDQRMSDAHLKFSGIEGTTDVLTFDLAPETNPGSAPESFDSKVLDTDLTICFDEAQRQSTKLGHSVERELLLYIIHGVLHCLGYNDHNDQDYQRMHQREDQLLSAIGVGNTFFTDQSNTCSNNSEYQQ